MIHIQCNFFSTALKRSTEIMVLLPSKHNADCLMKQPEEIYCREKEFPCLYLLHGGLDDHTSWIRGTGIERYSEKHQIAVVMPSGGNSFFLDMHQGEQYFTFLTKELPKFVNYAFRISQRRENVIIGGISMGGYAALHAAYCYPEQYGKVIAISAVTDIEKFLKNEMTQKTKVFSEKLLFGDIKNAKKHDYDLQSVIKLKLKIKNSEMPVCYLSCGKEDDLCMEMNQEMHEFLKEHYIEHYYAAPPGGHCWEFWDDEIREALDYVQMK